MKNTNEGEALGIYLEDEWEGEICREMDLSEVGEENPPRILKNHRKEALDAGGRLLELEEKKRRRGRRGAGAFL
jgi:hypothetical protein